MPVELLTNNVNILDLKITSPEGRLLKFDPRREMSDLVKSSLIQDANDPSVFQTTSDYIHKAEVAATIKNLFPEIFDQVNLRNFKEKVLFSLEEHKKRYFSAIRSTRNEDQIYIIQDWIKAFSVSNTLFPESKEVEKNKEDLFFPISNQLKKSNQDPGRYNVWYVLTLAYSSKILFEQEELLGNKEQMSKVVTDELNRKLNHSQHRGINYADILNKLVQARVVYPANSYERLLTANHWAEIKSYKDTQESSMTAKTGYYHIFIYDMALLAAPKIKIKDGLVIPVYEENLEVSEKPIPERRKY